MFFNKSQISTPAKPLNLSIIGTSPLAFFLANIFINQGHKTTVLVPQNKLASFNKLNPFIIKTSGFQSHRFDIPFASNLDTPSDFCFLASSPESNHSDILLLQETFIKDTPLINLSTFYNHRLLPQLNKEFFPAWFSGWLNLEKNNLILLERNSKLEINCPQDIFDKLSPLFNQSSLNISFSIAKTDLFWPRLTSFFLSNLLLLASRQNISDALNQTQYRQLTDQAIKELELLTKKVSSNMSFSDILPQIYTLPDDYKSELSSPEGLIILSSLIENINPFDTPALNQLMTRATKNIRA